MRSFPSYEGMTFENLFEAEYFSNLRLEIEAVNIDSRATLEEMAAKATAAAVDEAEAKQTPACQALQAYNTALQVALSTIRNLLQFHPDSRIFNTDEALVVKEPNPVLRNVNPFNPDGGMIHANSNTHVADFDAMTRLRQFLEGIYKK